MSRYFILPVYSVYLPKLSLLFLKNEKKIYSVYGK